MGRDGHQYASCLAYCAAEPAELQVPHCTQRSGVLWYMCANWPPRRHCVAAGQESRGRSVEAACKAFGCPGACTPCLAASSPTWLSACVSSCLAWATCSCPSIAASWRCRASRDCSTWKRTCSTYPSRHAPCLQITILPPGHAGLLQNGHLQQASMFQSPTDQAGGPDTAFTACHSVDFEPASNCALAGPLLCRPPKVPSWSKSLCKAQSLAEPGPHAASHTTMHMLS